ncbi:hypothetical protein AMTRI_Chr09g39550 [Amborella trichopoda]
MKKSNISSPMKALCNNFGPIACTQCPQTQSFRVPPDMYKSFNSMFQEDPLSLSNDTLSFSNSMTSNSEGCSSTSSSSLSTDSSIISSAMAKSTKRFFFSKPGETKSILEEMNSKQEQNVDLVCENREIGCESRREMGCDFYSEKKDLGCDFYSEKKDLGCDSYSEKRGVECEFYSESVTMSMSSEDPLWDFRVSMEEMIEAHGLRDWAMLHELLQCYLKLNEKRTHKYIVGAFLDLLFKMVAEAEREKD